MPFGIKDIDLYNEKKFGVFINLMSTIEFSQFFQTTTNFGYSTKHRGTYLYPQNGHGYIVTHDSKFSIFKNRLDINFGLQYRHLQFSETLEDIDLRFGLSYSSNWRNNLGLYYSSRFHGKNSLILNGFGVRWYIVLPDKSREWMRERGFYSKN